MKYLGLQHTVDTLGEPIQKPVKRDTFSSVNIFCFRFSNDGQEEAEEDWKDPRIINLNTLQRVENVMFTPSGSFTKTFKGNWASKAGQKSRLKINSENKLYIFNQLTRYNLGLIKLIPCKVPTFSQDTLVGF